MFIDPAFEVEGFERCCHYVSPMSITGGLRPVSFTEAVAHVGYREGAVRLRGNLDVIRFAVMFRRRWCLRTWRRSRQRCYGYRLLLLVYRIRDKHSRDGVFLAAELRKLNLPHIFN